MTTITILEEDLFDKTEFKNISKLLDILSIRKAEKDFSLGFINEKNSREKDLLTGKTISKARSTIKDNL